MIADKLQLIVVIGQGPGFGLVQPHQRRFDVQCVVHSRLNSGIQRFDELIPAIGVVGKVYFTDAGDDRLRLYLVGVNRCEG